MFSGSQAFPAHSRQCARQTPENRRSIASINTEEKIGGIPDHYSGSLSAIKIVPEPDC
jgi:hypothetical protein